MTIRVSDVDQAARVERSDEGSVVVRPARPADFAIDLGGAQAVIEAVDADGLQRIVGTLRRDDDDPDLLVLSTSSVDDIQRRQFVRVEIGRRIEIRRPGRPAVRTWTINVSGSGFLLAGPDDLKPGDRIDMSVALSESEEPLLAKGEVARITADGHRGVHILEIGERDRERLIQFCFERQAAPRVRLE